jgi:hypothetical protein
MADALFTVTDDPSVFHATPHTEGPWEPGMQHGGPVAALLARTVEQTPSSIAGPAQVTRLTIEILGPVPVGEVHARGAVVRPGRSVELVSAELVVDGRAAAKAHAWRIRRASIEVPVAASAPAALPDTTPPVTDPFLRTGFLGTHEWRFVRGGFMTGGGSLVWARQRLPLVAGEQPSGLQRLMAVADCGNGLSGSVDFSRWWFINVDLTVHLHREPAGEWLCVEAASAYGPSGAGLAETELFDLNGRLGRGAQSLLVGPR